MSKIAKATKKLRYHVLFVVITFSVTAMITSFFVKPLVEFERYSYPEEEYQILENEITRIIEDKDNVSAYEYTSHYNPEKNILTIKMDGEKASITAEIINCGKDTQSFSKTREVKNEKEHEEIQNYHAKLEKQGKFAKNMLYAGFITFIIYLLTFMAVIKYDDYKCSKSKKENIESEENQNTETEEEIKE